MSAGFLWLPNKGVKIKDHNSLDQRSPSVSSCNNRYFVELSVQDFAHTCAHAHMSLLIPLTSNQSLLIYGQFQQTDALRLADERNNKAVNASSAPGANNQPFHMSHSGIDWQAKACLCWHTLVFLLSFSPWFPPFRVSALLFIIPDPHSAAQSTAHTTRSLID